MFNVGSVQGYLKLNTVGWNTSMRSANASITALSRSFTRLGAVAVGSLLLITREFGKFDKAMRHATSVSETTNEQFAQMSQMALDASVKWNKAATDTAQAFYFLGSAGLTVTEQLQAFNTTIMLSRAMGSELGQTVEGVVDVVRAFGLEFRDIDHIADQLTKTVTSSNMTFATLTRALSYASSTARLTNNTLADTTAMLGFMANAGIKGSMAGTVLRRSMTNLMAGSTAMTKVMYELGISAYDMNGEMLKSADIMALISEKMIGVSGEYKNMIMRTLFGQRAIAGQIVLFNQGAEAVDAYSDAIKNATGITERVAKKQMEALLEVMGRLWQQIRRVAITTGEMLAPALIGLSNIIREKLAVLNDYIKANSNAVASTLKWVAVLGMAAVVLPVMAAAVAAIANQFIQLGIALATVAVASAPLIALIGLIYLLRATLATNFWAQAWNNSIKPFLSVMGKGFTQTLTQIMWQFSLIPDVVAEVFTGSMVMSSLKYFTKALQQIGLAARMAEIALHFEPGWIDRIKELGGEFNKLNEEMRDLLFGGDPEMNMLSEVVFPDTEAATASYRAYAAGLKVVGDEIAYQGKAMAVGFGEHLKTILKKDLDMLSKLLASTLPDGMRDALEILKELYEAFMAETTRVIAEELPEAVDESNKRIAESTKEATGLFATRWRNAILQVVDGTRSWHDVFVDTASSIRDKWKDTMSNLRTDGGNFKDFMERMFLDVLDSFNAMVAEFAANRLFYEVFGGVLGDTFKPPHESSIVGVDTESAAVSTTSDRMQDMLSRLPGDVQKMAVVVNMNNNTRTPIKATAQKPVFNGREYVINVVMEEYNTNPNFRNVLNNG